jgi:hypothetical protein
MPQKNLLFVILAAMFAVVACGCLNVELPVSEEEQAQVVAFANPITDNLLQGFNQGNYTMYSRDFSSEMKQALDVTDFEQNRALIISKIGLPVSRGEPVVTQIGEYLAVNYKSDFEHEQGVDVRVVFKKGDESHQIYGLWFNSPKLRS